MSKVTTSFFLIIALTASPLLFIGGVDDGATRSLKLLWNAGHIPFFYLWAYLFLHWQQPYFDRSPLLFSLLILILAFITGLSIEYLQALIGRQFSWQDLALDITGAALAIGQQWYLAKKMPPSWRKIIATVGLVIIAVVCTPLITTIADEASAYRQFPVLADFSTPFEIDRFSGNSHFSLASDKHKPDNKLLSVTFNTNKYSQLSLHYFNGDWRQFEQLRFDVFNPKEEALKLVCRIHDDQHHKNSFAFNDRFNKSYQLKEGWHQINILLEDVKAAPAGRQMNLARIKNISCFTIALKKPRRVFFDNFRLTN